jgi:putative FmdB family regulatory protein
MPIYEYKCDDCGSVSEVLVRNTQNPGIVVCSDCHSDNVSRLVSVPGAVMTKGSSAASANVPPINCPNINTCGASSSECPAARMRR